jgi:hypothetical protein
VIRKLDLHVIPPISRASPVEDCPTFTPGRQPFISRSFQSIGGVLPSRPFAGSAAGPLEHRVRDAAANQLIPRSIRQPTIRMPIMRLPPKCTHAMT